MSAPEIRKWVEPEMPQGLRSRAFRGVEKLLRDFGDLDSRVKVWKSMDGQPEDDQDPAWDQTPMVAVLPHPRPDSVLSNAHATVNFAIAVRIWLPGSCVDEMLDFWDLVCEACRLDREYVGSATQVGDTVYSYLRCGIPGVSIPNLVLVDPAVPVVAPGRAGGDATIQRAAGSIAFQFQRPR